jgi:hypothetical protein
MDTYTISSEYENAVKKTRISFQSVFTVKAKLKTKESTLKSLQKIMMSL